MASSGSQSVDGCWRLLLLQKEEHTIEGKQKEILLLMEENDGVRGLLRLRENGGQTLNTQLTR